jgi:hypothetical protein
VQRPSLRLRASQIQRERLAREQVHRHRVELNASTTITRGPRSFLSSTMRPSPSVTSMRSVGLSRKYVNHVGHARSRRRVDRRSAKPPGAA